MGGDFGPRLVVSACVKSLQEHPKLRLVLVGDSEKIESVLAQHPQADRSRLTLQHASECISMDDLLAFSLRHKPDSSMLVAFQFLSDNQVQAFVIASYTVAIKSV